MSVYGYGSREVNMATQNTRTAEGRPLKGVRVYKDAMPKTGTRLTSKRISRLLRNASDRRADAGHAH
jgi:hypothetical protein